jgi:putative Ca2+/H+ antiporter (TMEM165/GDT1 family)
MDWKIVAATFSSVFLAEIGDKTQLMTLTLAGAGGSKLSVFVGAASALVATTTIAVLVGELATQVVPAVWLRRAAGSLFVLLGVYFLWSSRAAGGA